MSKKKVLVVDDQPVFREFFQKSLTKLGFEVITAFTGKIALVRAREHKPDLIMLDVMLPDMDGIDICRKLREQSETSETPIILVSAVASEKHIQRATEAGATTYMIKPLSMEDINSLVKNYLSE
jgi:DNA-binding response OmpR family regulator